METTFYVYILASGPCGYLYIGQTENLERRTREHRSAAFADAYTSRHAIHHLVYYETWPSRTEAKRREAVLKKLARTKKFRLIEQTNPHWADLAAAWL
jgi:putative endonuclease